MTAPVLVPLPLRSNAEGLSADVDGCRWLGSIRRLAIASECRLVTGAEETCAILLAGTFDLVGGTTSWPSRGARTSPLSGRPVAVYLPPHTPFAAQNGNGEILLLGARKPPTVAPIGRAALQQSPLLPLAGSGKSFDPNSGEWRPAETFPTAPESLPPRRIARLPFGATVIERVFAADYKATTLVVDEFVLPAAATLSLHDLPLPVAACECMIYLRCGGDVAIDAGADALRLRGEAACVLRAPATALTIRTGALPAYLVLAHAGK